MCSPRSASARRVRSGGPIVGFGWDERAWSHPLRPPRRDELDQAAGGAVVFLDRADAHGSAVSTALLEAYPHIRDRAATTTPAG